jgi:hypothetical protein
MSGLIGKKLGMTSIFDANGKQIPCTVIEVGPCVVTQVKTILKDGYNSIISGRSEVEWRHDNQEILKEKYGEDISCQYKYEKCIFDFINISKNTLYECKISLKDYNEVQHKKYIVSLTKYNIIYLISTDCIVDMNSQIIYTTNPTEYLLYICNIPLLPKMSKLDEIIQTFTITKIKDINEGLF